MIQNFRDKDTEQLCNRQFVRRFAGIERSAIRRLRLLDSSETMQAVAMLPGNRFEALKGDRQGEYSIRINKQWQICFRWGDAGPYDVETVDYH